MLHILSKSESMIDDNENLPAFLISISIIFSDAVDSKADKSRYNCACLNQLEVIPMKGP